MSVTFAKGFMASGVAAGLKANSQKDIALVVNTGKNNDASGVFTKNNVKAAPVIWTAEVIKNKKLKAVLLNSGGANACTGVEGFADTHQCAEYVAKSLSVGAIEIGICSTGLIGNRLDMKKFIPGIDNALKNLHVTGGFDAAEAIITTDSHSKTAEYEIDGWRMGAMIKGAGMLAPDMATMLCVITTDADISEIDHQGILKQITDRTLNRIDSDGCTSTNDTVLLMSSGDSNIKPTAGEFSQALQDLMQNLSLQLINDAEGSTKVIRIAVINALNEHDAVEVGRSIARNNLLKCAMFGEDPNWGRILAAVGTANAEIDPNLISVELNGLKVCAQGAALTKTPMVDLSSRDISILVNLNVGKFEAVIYTNDLSTKYVHENSAYST